MHWGSSYTILARKKITFNPNKRWIWTNTQFLILLIGYLKKRIYQKVLLLQIHCLFFRSVLLMIIITSTIPQKKNPNMSFEGRQISTFPINGIRAGSRPRTNVFLFWSLPQPWPQVVSNWEFACLCGPLPLPNQW